MSGFTFRDYASDAPPLKVPGASYHGRVPRLHESLLCPVCHSRLRSGRADRSEAGFSDGARRLLLCEQGHHFDAAKQGYFNLLTGKGTAFEADSAAMIHARSDFLAAGHYRPLAEAVVSAAQLDTARPARILDAGAGTGYYLHALLEQNPAAEAIAMDISKFALRRAARTLPDALCLVWDIWRTLPLAAGCVDVLLNIFAPRNPQEFARVVAGGGILVSVTPLPRHLREIADLAGLLEVPAGKGRDVAEGLADSFTELSSTVVEYTMNLSATDIADVAAMGPAGHHHARLDPATIPAQTAVTASFTVQTFRRTP